MGYDKYYIYRKQVSLDSGATWDDVVPIEEAPSGDSIGTYSTIYECEVRPVPPMYTWRQVDNEFICEGAIKYYKQYKMVSNDGGTTWQNVSPAVTRPGEIKHYGSAECLGISATTNDYLTLYAVDNCVFSSIWGMLYSVDGGEWKGYSEIALPVEVPAGHTIRIKKDIYSVALGAESSGRYIAYGNAFSASMDIEGVNWDTVEPDDFPRFIFSHSTAASGLTDASMLLLPAKKIKDNAYVDMFRGCTNMVLPPQLPATSIAYGCYANMFTDCTSLEIVPLLPATNLARLCYDAMFSNCTSLETLPNNMLPATNLSGGESCYRNMFFQCSNLRTVPSNLLPATTLEDYCYESMFRECKSLNTPPALPATNLNIYCYQYMFADCWSISYAPALPATTLANYCYNGMFYRCVSLIKAPDLSASTLVYGCYYQMFRECHNLTELKCLATSIPSDCNPFESGKTHPFQNWLRDVYTDEGVLYKKSAMSYVVDGVSQVPYSWLQIDI